MLHAAADDCNAQLNFNLSSSSLSKQNLDINNQTSSQLNLLDASNESSKKSPNNCLESKENLLISFSLNAAKSDLLPSSHSAEKLSWKFFEQVDSLDNQLRSDVSSPPCALLNGGGLFLTSPTTDEISCSSTTNDVNLIVANSLNALGMHSNHQQHHHQQHTLGQTQTQLQTLPQGCNRLMRQQTLPQLRLQLQQQLQI
ncbi:uncharacterized protein LOC135957109 [Calliphora vicina]|uniref:uncharacterized protein LOC135957109 n=1 Tax=Calliphora vicina TaxID=7373 RepID=UPI00325ADD01